MTRYKGRASPKAIEREFPHIVETIVPEGGFGKNTRRHVRLGRRDENGRDIIRWCFADPKLAEAFANEFNELRTI